MKRKQVPALSTHRNKRLKKNEDVENVNEEQKTQVTETLVSQDRTTQEAVQHLTPQDKKNASVDFVTSRGSTGRGVPESAVPRHHHDDDEVKCGPRATYVRNQAIKATIKKLRVKHKRQLFLLVRTTRHVSDQSFFPRCGFTAGQFCVLQALNEGSRSKRSTPAS